jgi:LacI family transcriptional regulator
MERKRIAILSSFFRHGQWRGIMRYGQEVGWICQRYDRDNVDCLSQGGVDGILFQAADFDQALLNYVSGSDLPCVGLRALRGDEKRHPLVLLDLAAVGRTVATHFLKNSVRRLVYLGLASDESSNAGCTHVQGMREAAAGQGIRLDCIFPDRAETWRSYGLEYRDYSPTGWDRFWELGPAMIDRWAESKEPIGVFSSFVEPAMELIEMLAERGVEVPQRISIAAQTEDGSTGLITKTPLSCVVPNYEQQGYMAARLLDGILDGKPVRQSQPLLVSSARFIPRESSNQIVTSDPLVREMLSHIRSNALESEYSPQTLATAFGCSLRFVQIRFREALRKGVAEVIRELRTDQAAILIRDTKKPFHAIIGECGFSNHHHLERAVKRSFGVNPSKLRQDHHNGV